MSTLAVFIALGGTSYAVSQLPRNSVGSAQLRKDAVTSAKIRDGAVARTDLAPNALLAGPRGPRGEQGPLGPVGPTEVIQARRGVAVPIPSNGGGSATLATLTLDAGSWSIEAQTVVNYQPSSPGSEWYDCRLQTGTGIELAFASARVGTDAYGVAQTPIPVRRAVTFDASTQVAFVCSHPSPIATPPAVAVHSVLQATRVGRVDERAP